MENAVKTKYPFVAEYALYFSKLAKYGLMCPSLNGWRGVSKYLGLNIAQQVKPQDCRLHKVFGDQTNFNNDLMLFQNQLLKPATNRELDMTHVANTAVF